MSPVLISLGVGHVRAKFGEKGVDRYKPNINGRMQKE